MIFLWRGFLSCVVGERYGNLAAFILFNLFCPENFLTSDQDSAKITVAHLKKGKKARLQKDLMYRCSRDLQPTGEFVGTHF